MNLNNFISKKTNIIIVTLFLLALTAGDYILVQSKKNIVEKQQTKTILKITPSPIITSPSPSISTPSATLVVTQKPSIKITTTITLTPTPIKATATPVPPATSTPTPVKYQDTNGPTFGAHLPPINVPINYNNVCLSVFDIKDNDSSIDEIYIQFSFDGSISGLSKNVEKCYNNLSNGHHSGWIKVYDKWGNESNMNVSFDVQVSAPTQAPTNTPIPTSTAAPSPTPEPTQ